VGKTTCSLVLAHALCRKGRRVLLLTVDPARRLHALIESVRETHPGLDVARIEVSTAFADFVRRHSPDEATAREILGSRFFPYLSEHLVALHDYVAGDVIIEAVASGRYDHVVVDTPPFAHAVHFLEAPERLHEMASRAAAIFGPESLAAQTGISLLPAFLSRGLSYFLGKGFLTELIEFIASFSKLWSGIAAQALALQDLWRTQTTFVAVVVPDMHSLDDLFRMLEKAPPWIEPGMVLVNRFLDPPAPAGAGDLRAETAAEHAVSPGAGDLRAETAAEHAGSQREHAEAVPNGRNAAERRAAEIVSAIAAGHANAMDLLAQRHPGLASRVTKLPLLPRGVADPETLDVLVQRIG